MKKTWNELRCSLFSGRLFEQNKEAAVKHNLGVLRITLLSVILGIFIRRTRLEHDDMKRTLEGYAYTDELTGLYNRRGFFAKAEELIAEHEPGYYVMASFDVESFKVVNDQYGARQGDAVLCHIADTFQKGFEPEGGICSRISADNFAVLYPKSFMASKKLSEIRKAAASQGAVMPISFSIGRYIVDDPSLSASAMYDRASLAERVAKGRYDANIVLYDESMRARLLHEQKIVTEMRPALESGQFEVWFQPQYNHVSGALIGSEALVRWRQPESGRLIPPQEFIPVFERNGFIYEMDKYVWEQSCILLRRWIDEGRNPLPVSVNVSRHDVFHADFYNTITGLVERYGLPVGLLRLEITETAFAKATEQIIAVVKKLIAYGFTVEIDDFGSGYSSLNTLKNVPAQILKLDMKFLEKTDDSEHGGIILESIVRMAKWLGMAVIAEGVETKEQADYLKSIGCHYVQGYLYARPMPPADYKALAKGHGKEAEMISLETVDNLNNNCFWSPESMDTFVFNSYVGGACVVEFNAGRLELLRVNDRYISELGIKFEAGEPFSTLDLYQYMDEESKATVAVCVARALETGAEITDEFRLLPAKGRIESKQHIRCAFRAIARVGERALFYCVVSNVTEQRRAEQKEHEALTELAQMVQDMPGGYAKMKITATGIVPLFLNDEFCRLCGMTHEQAVAFYGDDAYTGVHPDDIAQANVLINKAIENRTTVSLRVRLTDGRGAYVPVQAFYRVTEDADGLYLNGYYTDATALSRLEEMRQELLENLPCGAGIYEITEGGMRATYLNKQYRAYLKREIGELSEAPVFEVVHPDDIEKLKGEIRKAITEAGEGNCDIRIVDGAGGYIPFHVTGRVMERSRDKTALYVTYVPVTEKELLMQRRAETDGMTGIYNKTTAESLIRDQLSGHSGLPCTMMIVDVDDLKTINDSLGHPQGDRAICLVADTLRAQFRKTDIIGRIGGDEFAVYLEGVESREKLESLAAQLLQSLSAAAADDAHESIVHVSIGIAQGVTGQISFDELYTMADRALYTSKRSGKNQYTFFPSDKRPAELPALREAARKGARMISITDREHKPSLEELSEYIGNPLFDTLCGCLQTGFKASVEIAYSGDTVLLGWNVRFYRSGRTLCRLYPKEGFFSVLLVVGRRERERVEALLPELSAPLQRVYRDTPEGMGQRWLLLDFHEPDAAYEDLLRLVRIRAEK